MKENKTIRDFIIFDSGDKMSLKDINLRMEIWNEEYGLLSSLNLKTCKVEFVRSNPIIFVSLDLVDKNKISPFFLEESSITLSGDGVYYKESAFVWGISGGKRDNLFHILIDWTDRKNNKLLKDLNNYAEERATSSN